MKKYELMYIVNANLDEEARDALIERMHTVLTDNGATIDKVDQWGLRDFAYEINHMTKGYYVVVEFTGEGGAVDEFKRLALINRDIVRHMIIALDQE